MKTITIESVKEKACKQIASVIKEWIIRARAGEEISAEIRNRMAYIVEQSIKESLEELRLKKYQVKPELEKGTYIGGFNDAVNVQQELIDKYLNKK